MCLSCELELFSSLLCVQEPVQCRQPWAACYGDVSGGVTWGNLRWLTGCTVVAELRGLTWMNQ